MKIEAAHPLDFAWLKERTGCALTDDFNAIKAIDARGIRGMVGYCGWTKSAVTMHIAVDSPIVWRRLVGPGLEYPFRQADRQVVLGIVAESNRRSWRFAQAVGFKTIARIQDGAAGGDDLLILELRREDWEAAKPLHRRDA